MLRRIVDRVMGRPSVEPLVASPTQGFDISAYIANSVRKARMRTYIYGQSRYNPIPGGGKGAAARRRRAMERQGIETVPYGEGQL